jgi:hypothetical protein
MSTGRCSQCGDMDVPVAHCIECGYHICDICTSDLENARVCSLCLDFYGDDDG